MYEHKVKITKGLWDAFKAFKTKYPETDVTRKRYVDICHSVNKKLSDKIIKESLLFKIPFRLGTLGIVKSKLKIKIKDGKVDTNKLRINYGATWEYWNKLYPGKTRKEINEIPGKIVIYHTNDHTNGYIMRWNWSKRGSKFINRQAYLFKPTKYNRLNLASHIKSDDRENDYYIEEKYGKDKRRKKEVLSELE